MHYFYSEYECSLCFVKGFCDSSCSHVLAVFRIFFPNFKKDMAESRMQKFLEVSRVQLEYNTPNKVFALPRLKFNWGN